MMQMAQVAQAPRRGRKPLNEKKKRRKRNRPGSHIKRAKTAYFFFLDDFRKSYCKDGDQIPKVRVCCSHFLSRFLVGVGCRTSHVKAGY